MSTISSAAEQRASIHRPGHLRTLVSAPKRLWVAYVTWRVEQTLILLRTMSDEKFDAGGLGADGCTGLMQGENGCDTASGLPGGHRTHV